MSKSSMFFVENRPTITPCMFQMLADMFVVLNLWLECNMLWIMVCLFVSFPLVNKFLSILELRVLITTLVSDFKSLFPYKR